MLTNVKKTHYLRANALLKQAYENTFGIFDYIDYAYAETNITDPKLKRPLASVELHPAIDSSLDSKLYAHIKLFADLEIGKYYNISLSQYLELPHDIANFIRKDCSSRREKRHSEESVIVKELKNEIKN